MPTYYTDRASYDAAYRAKRNKRLKIVLIAVFAAAIVLDLLIFFLCPDQISTIINFGGTPLVIDKLIFVIAAGIVDIALVFVGLINEEKRLSLIVWICFILIIMLVSFFKSL